MKSKNSSSAGTPGPISFVLVPRCLPSTYSLPRMYPAPHPPSWLNFSLTSSNTFGVALFIHKFTSL